MERSEQTKVLLFRLQRRTYALPLACVREVMRPLPVEPVAGAPPGLCGVSIIRGRPTPVLDLAGVLGGNGPVQGGRVLVVDLGERSVALLVEAVSGVEDLPADGLEGVPPLLQEAAGRAIRAMGSLDRELLLVLEAARLVPEEVWQHLRGEIRAST